MPPTVRCVSVPLSSITLVPGSAKERLRVGIRQLHEHLDELCEVPDLPNELAALKTAKTVLTAQLAHANEKIQVLQDQHNKPRAKVIDTEEFWEKDVAQLA